MSFAPSENGSIMPLRPALKDPEEPMSPRSGPVKVVSIAEPADTPPLSTGEDSSRIKQFKAGVADKRMTGKPGFLSHSSSRLSLISVDEPLPHSDNSTPKHKEEKQHGQHHRHHRHHHEKLLSQVAAWLEAEKAKRHVKKSKRRGDSQLVEDDVVKTRPRTSSQSSDSSAISLEKLQKILEDNMSSLNLDSVPAQSPNFGPRRPSTLTSRRRSSVRKVGAMSSDTEYHDGDVVVPSCDVVLDNSKTMSYSGGAADSSHETVTLSTSKRAEKERKAWLAFKGEILRLAHTLRLKGWRRVPLERGGDIEVERLSGALTNAVYVVSPPTNLPLPAPTPEHPKPHAPKPPPKLLLRVYGPQVEHLIDRENELAILRRLARKKIGPRMLGTFTNGRFEEFFNAKTLTADDLRVEGTFKQIAKRMRELHDGMELLEREREQGPFVWLNWDKWVDRCAEVTTFLDKEISSGRKGKGEFWRTRGYVCGVPWPQFKAAIDKYRKWLDEYYGKDGIRRRLVFAHNDTQYGNILRLVPEPPSKDSSPSPLLLPQNTHKQLVVIDFEYASANTPGLEFANHFTEWCYNYHDPSGPWKCDTRNYPSLEQQKRFIRSYVNHRPQFNPSASATPKTTPQMNPMDGLARGSIGEFLLDSRTPGGSHLDLGAAAIDYSQEEAQREQETEKKVVELLKEIQIWRIANSAQWVAWGIVQAKVPGLETTTTISDAEVTEEPGSMNGDGATDINGNGSADSHPKESSDKRPEGLKAEALRAGETPKEAEALEDEEDEFDYLAYARDRAMFFWADMVGMGIVEREELPADMIKDLKFIENERCLLGRAKWRA